MLVFLLTLSVGGTLLISFKITSKLCCLMKKEVAKSFEMKANLLRVNRITKLLRVNRVTKISKDELFQVEK